jgi:Rrf2 family iron-sulfur cluster assembly transcriptional regulator
MTDLAQHDGDKYVSLKDISERQEISNKYLEMIIGILNKAGFVLSLRGKSGGYKLAKKPHEYTVGSIIKLTEGNLAPVACLENEINRCPRADRCITLPVWRKLEKLIDDYLESITIEDLINGQYDLAGDDYCI